MFGTGEMQMRDSWSRKGAIAAPAAVPFQLEVAFQALGLINSRARVRLVMPPGTRVTGVVLVAMLLSMDETARGFCAGGQEGMMRGRV
jgi:hypothetical protein